MSETPEAMHDTLFVVDALTGIAGGAIPTEITLFCYLGCLLGMFDEQPSSTWGYSFTATKTVAPYSASLDDCLKGAVNSGLVTDTGNGYVLTDAGQRELQFLSELSRFSRRRTYLIAGCNSGLVVPMPRVGAAIAAEPELRRALALSSSRQLLGDGGAGALHAHFEALSEALPDDAGLFVTAVTWVSYLASGSDIQEDSVAAGVGGA